MQWLSQLYVRGTAYMYICLTVIVRLQHITTYLSHMTVADAICSACNCLRGKDILACSLLGQQSTIGKWFIYLYR